MKIALPMSEDESKTQVNTAYIDYIVNGGYTPILIIDHMSSIKNCMKAADALMLPGGIDVDPTYYGIDNTKSYFVDPNRDNFERILLKQAIDKGIPIFGICRGHQLITYEAGFNMLKGDFGLFIAQDIHGHDQKDNGVARSNVSHSVEVIRRLYDPKNKSDNTEKLFVNSMHHQAVIIPKTDIPIIRESGMDILAYTAKGYSTYSVKDKITYIVIEAMAIPEFKILSVQWHPEETMDLDLLESALTRW